MPKKIRLSTDYQCWPLWQEEGEEVGDIDPKALPLQPETVARLEHWAATFDSWIDLDEPNAPTEPTAEECEAFEQEGLRLWKQLSQELAPHYEVVYSRKRRGQVLQHLGELKRA